MGLDSGFILKLKPLRCADSLTVTHERKYGCRGGVDGNLGLSLAKLRKAGGWRVDMAPLDV